jgi:hypothetical protein
MPVHVIGPLFVFENSSPMKIIGIPGIVSSRPVAARERLRANHE